MAIVLRDYQVDIIDEIRQLMMKGQRAILVVSPTGSGKTALTAHMLASAAAKKMASWFNVHRRELINQSAKTFDKVDVFHGIIANNYPPDDRALVQIASIPTLVNRMHKITRRPRLIIWDECHHIAAGSWAKIFKAYPDAFHIGLTATPERLDGKGLGDFFKVMVKGPSVASLIEKGYLSKYKLFSPPGMDTTGLRTRAGEFIHSDLDAIANKPTITGNAIREYRSLAPGKKAIVFTVGIEHSRNIVYSFNQAGFRFAHIDGETDPVVRERLIKEFERGDLDGLSNVGLFAEGFDVPGIEVVIDLAPTNSLGQYLQRFGRALRPAEGKEFALYLDHAGNADRHGLPDEDREWSLDGRLNVGGGKKAEPSVKICPKCFAAQKAGPPSCFECGTEFEIKVRKLLEAEGNLKEMSREEMAERRQKKQNRAQQGMAESLDDLIALGKKRGYKKPEAWAKHIFQSRQAKKLKTGR